MKKSILATLLLVASMLSFAQKNPMVISCGQATATFKDGCLESFKDADGIDWVEQSASQGGLFQIAYINSKAPEDGTKYLNSRSAASITQADPNTIVFADFQDNAPPFKVTCTIKPQGDMIAWNIQVEIPDNLVLTILDFPRIHTKIFDPDNDQCVMGSTKGGALIPSKMQENRHIAARQPGSLALQFASQTAAKNGLYLAAQDPKCHPKTLACVKLKDAIRWQWSTLTYTEKNFKLPFDIVTTTFKAPQGADKVLWQDAADIYKQWALKQEWCQTTFINRKDVPQWLKDGPGMVRFHRSWFAEKNSIQNWVEKVWNKDFPKTHLIAAMWGWEKIDSWITPDYFPVFPNNETFKEITDFLHKNNAHPFPWPSGYHWTLTYNQKADGTFAFDDRERFEAFKSHAIVNPDGKMYIRNPGWLKKGECTAMCPGDPWTINWWNNDICRPLAELGCDMIQVDQVVGGAFPPCYATHHGHPKGYGQWMVDAFATQLKTMYQTMKEVVPEPVLAVEEPNESFNHLVGIMDYRNCQPAQPWTSPFNYVYHEFLPCFQSNPRTSNRFWYAYCAADGQIPHFVPRMADADPILLSGGDFEDLDTNGFPVKWGKVGGYKNQVWNGHAESCSTDAQSGKRSLRLVNKPGETVQVSRNCSVDKGLIKNGAKYRISAWLKTKKLTQKAAINAAPFTSDLKREGNNCYLSFPDKPSDWQLIQGIVEPTIHADFIRIMIHVEGECDVLVDNVTLEVSKPDGSWEQALLPTNDQYYAFAKNWVKAYKDHNKWLQHGKLLRPPKLICDSTTDRGVEVPTIFHNAFQAPDGTIAVVFASNQATPQQATLHWKDKTFQITANPDEIIVMPME